MLTRRDQLIRDIEAAFRDVERGNGLTLHEARPFEGTDYCTATERARVRALDLETHWQDIPECSLKECLDRWAYEDEGFRFHLPACLRWHVRHPRGRPRRMGRAGLAIVLVEVQRDHPAGKDSMLAWDGKVRCGLEVRLEAVRKLPRRIPGAPSCSQGYDVLEIEG